LTHEIQGDFAIALDQHMKGHYHADIKYKYAGQNLHGNWGKLRHRQGNRIRTRKDGSDSRNGLPESR